MKVLSTILALCLATCTHLSAQELHSSDRHAQQATVEASSDDFLRNYPGANKAGLDLPVGSCRQGYRHLAAGQYDQAKRAFETALLAVPAQAEAYYGLGECHLLTRNYPRAIRYFEEAAALGMPGAYAQVREARIAQTYFEIEEAKGGWR